MRRWVPAINAVALQIATPVEPLKAMPPPQVTAPSESLIETVPRKGTVTGPAGEGATVTVIVTGTSTVDVAGAEIDVVVAEVPADCVKILDALVA